jgi:hypothetical protein
VVVEQGRGLDDMVVDAHQDQILGLRHGETPDASLTFVSEYRAGDRAAQ